MSPPVADRIAELTTARVPFVRATVVRAQEPTSAHPGDEAIVLADGTVEGFVGGQCAVVSVRTAALGVLEAGTSLLLRVLPEQETTFPSAPGASVVVNPCLSGGALEIFLQPQLPPPVLFVAGASPTAEVLVTLAGALGFAVARDVEADDPIGAVAAVVATHGGDEPSAVKAALDAGVGYVGLVCSHRRGEALLAELGLDELDRATVHPHAGMDIGARTPAEVALAILADVVRRMRLDGLSAPSHPAGRPVTIADPVCGMTVTVAADTPHTVVEGSEYWFCSASCLATFEKEHSS